MSVGSTCELDIDECTSNPCQNGGLCRNNLAAFICDCPQPYKGAECALLPCQVNPCGPGGSNCTDDLTYLPLGFRCDCMEGYTGEFLWLLSSFFLSFFLSINGRFNIVCMDVSVIIYLTIIELTNIHVCGNRLLQRLMSPSPKSQVMFESAFS